MQVLVYTYHPKNPPEDAEAAARWALWPLAPTDDPREAARLRMKEVDLDLALRPLGRWNPQAPWALPPEAIVRVDEAVHPHHVTFWEQATGGAPKAKPTRRLTVTAPLDQPEHVANFTVWASQMQHKLKRNRDVRAEMVDAAQLPPELVPVPRDWKAFPPGTPVTPAAETPPPVPPTPPAPAPSWTQTPTVNRRGG